MGLDDPNCRSLRLVGSSGWRSPAWRFSALFKRRFQFRVARVDARRVCLSPFAPRKYFRGAKGDVATPSPCYPRNS